MLRSQEMTSRTDMDRPATILSASLGVALIAVSILLFVYVGDATQTTYDITWEQTQGKSERSAFNVGTTPTQVPVSVEEVLPSNATVLVTCTDGAQAPVQSTASVSWKLFVAGTTAPLAQGTGCSATPTIVFLGGHPDVGSIKADSEAEAEELAMGDDLQSLDYRLEVTATRPANPGGLPNPVPIQFTGSATLTIRDHMATANVPGQEATLR